MPDYLTITDTTPRAKERNNLTIKRAPVGLINQIIAESHRQGVDPYASLAAAWKESGFGTLRGTKVSPQGNSATVPRFTALHVHSNPMQYNAMDLAPITDSNDREQRRAWSQNVFNTKIGQALQNDPAYVDAVSKYTSAIRSNDQSEAKFQSARTHAIATPIKQNLYIQGGVGYLKKVLSAHPNDLTGGFSRYRGGGKPAAYHGRHVKELYDSLKRNQDIRGLIDSVRMGA